MRKIISILLMLSLVMCCGWRGWGQGKRKEVPIVSGGSAPVGQQYPMFESVTMTSSNGPSPVSVRESSIYSSSYLGWNAFRRDGEATHWNTDNSSNPQWVIYDCGTGNSNYIAGLMVKNNANYGLSNMVFAGSQNDSDYTTLIDSTVLAKGAFVNKYTIASPAFYRYFKLSSTGAPWGGAGAVAEIELSSADISGPAMTATNAPSPYLCSANVRAGGYEEWYAMDRDTRTDHWWGGTATFPYWIKMDFGSNVVMNGVLAIFRSPYGFKWFQVDGSTNDVDYSTCGTGTFADVSTVQVFTNSNTTAYRWYKLTATNGYHSVSFGVTEITFKHYK
jgi:hypothetical protein